MSKNSNRIEALYLAEYDSAITDIAAIREKIESRRLDVDPVHYYSDVADMARNAAALKEIADRLLARGEYAPENILKSR